MSEQTTAADAAWDDARLHLETESPEHVLALVAAIRIDLEHLEQAAVRELRDRGASWSTIGDALGVTRAAAWQRFGP